MRVLLIHLCTLFGHRVAPRSCVLLYLLDKVIATEGFETFWGWLELHIDAVAVGK